MSRIIERALSIINDNLKDQTSSFADPISIKPMARGGRLLEDDYPTHYLPHVGRQVMADGGAPVKGFEGRVSSPLPVEEPVAAEGVEAYHGSPHEFEEFDPAFIGTGEGAQAYGHGLYFAENEDTAKQYSQNTEGKYSAGSIARRMLTNWGDRNTAIQKQKEHISRLEKDHKEDFITPYRGALNILESGKEPKTGHMYEVRIDAHPEEHMLDWDKPLSEQHPKIQEAVSARIEHLRNKYPEWVPDDPEGEWIYRSYRPQGEEEIPPGIDHDAHASISLKDLGVRGIRYADQGSRPHGTDSKIKKDLQSAKNRLEYLEKSSDPDSEYLKDLSKKHIAHLENILNDYASSTTHNYVIFDPKHIKVKRRYAEGGEVPEENDEGIVAYAFGNSVPHLDKRYEEKAPGKSELAQGVEPISEDAGRNQPSTYAKENDLLQPIGKSKMAGDEKLFFDDGLYKAGASTHAWNNKKSIRYLRHDEDGNPIGALQIMTHGPRTKKATIQNVYVAEDHRRKKIASELLKRARQDFDVRHSTDLTDQGRAFAKAAKAYGGSIIPGPKLTEENADDFARRLIAWTFATAPLFHKASGGAVNDDQGDDDSGLTAASLSDALSAAKQARQELINRKLPDRQRYAVNQYSGSQYETVNKSLRKPFNDTYKQNYASNIASNLRLAMRPLQTDMNVYRGIKSPKHVGDAVSFSSTSLSPEIAQSFAGENGHIMKIRVKKGTPVAYGDVESEREVILPPGKVNITKKTKSGPYTYHHGSYESLSNGGSVIDAALDVVSKLRR